VNQYPVGVDLNEIEEEEELTGRGKLQVMVIPGPCRYPCCGRRGLSRGAVRLPVAALFLASDQAIVLSVVMLRFGPHTSGGFFI